MTCSQCINIALSGSSVNRRSSSLRRATVCKAKPLCFCRPCRGWGGLTMLPILSTLLPQMTVSVASRLVAESRDWPHTQTQIPNPNPRPRPRPRPWSTHSHHQPSGLRVPPQLDLSHHPGPSWKQNPSPKREGTRAWCSQSSYSPGAAAAALAMSWLIDELLFGTIID